MTIVCGTDFSDDSARAELAAGHLAVKFGETLHLIHAVDVGAGERFEEARSALITWAGRHLARAADRLRELGCQVETHVEAGPPDEVLVELAERVGARLIVVAAQSRHAGDKQLGSHSDSIARRADLPVLLVRESSPFEAWGSGGRPLRVLLAVDFTASSEGAVDWVAELRRVGPCEVVAAHVYWPPGEYRRLGLRGVRSFVETDPEVSRALERDLRSRLDLRLRAAAPPQLGQVSSASVSLRIEAHLGRVADRLISIALEERVDLVVLGAHRRSALARLWEGSVSRAVMHDGRLSVACVPAPHEALARAAPAMRVLLAATDLSPLGDAGAGLAYAVVQPGGVVHLLHVDAELGREDAAEQAAEARRHLSSLEPPDAAARGVTTEVHILAQKQPADAICQAAERLGVDGICLGTHGRTGLARALLGSVAGEVISMTRRPILLARLPRE